MCEGCDGESSSGKLWCRLIDANNTAQGMEFYVINTPIFESSFIDMIGGEGYGIIPLYLTVVFMVGSWVRGLFADQVSSIIYDDMHNVDALVVLCETIYVSR